MQELAAGWLGRGATALASRATAAVASISDTTSSISDSTWETRPSEEQLAIANEARELKIYVYDLAAAGLAPPLRTVAPGSAVCGSPGCPSHWKSLCN